jgi:hypothetical protein
MRRDSDEPADKAAWADQGIDHDEISDADLTMLALAADPDLPLDPEAVPLAVYLAQAPGTLPEWYMAPAMARSGNRWRALVVLSIVGAFIFIEALGFCSAYGPLHLG